RLQVFLQHADAGDVILERIGYALVDAQGEVVAQFGGVFGNVPGIPNPLPLPNGDQVCGAVPGGEYDGYTLRSWDAVRPVTAQTIIAERERRLALGFDYDFGDERGVHRIGTTDADMKGWDEVSKVAQAAINLGQPSAPVAIVTDTGAVAI